MRPKSRYAGLSAAIRSSYSQGGKKKLKDFILNRGASAEDENDGSITPERGNWNSIYLFGFVLMLFFLMISGLFRLQVVRGQEFADRSDRNRLAVRSITPNRGIIFDRDGEKIVENEPSMNVILDLEPYLVEDSDNDSGVDEEALKANLKTLQDLLGDTWKSVSDEKIGEYKSLQERVFTNLEEEPYTRSLIVASGVNNDVAIKVKAKSDELKGVTVDTGSSRKYPYGEAFSHILGYTGLVNADDIESLDYVGFDDIIGKTGLEAEYDKELIGKKGEYVVEVDAYGEVVTEGHFERIKPISGKNLYLSVDKDAQLQAYEILRNGVARYGATGGTAIIEDIETGELLTIASYPSYDNNLFIGGISQSEYDTYLNDAHYPLLNRSIAAQYPPGSTFKTVIAAGALEDGAITPSTVYVSSSDYTFSNGAHFYEFGRRSYGSLTLNDALAVSSNIYFCETIRNWDTSMERVVPYLEKFGIGQYTNIDIPGESLGQLPSPQNKKRYYDNGATWVGSVWYPEGDSCNSAIGQGITLVTPIQMVNWVAAIANGGTLNTPHVGVKFVDADGKQKTITYEPLRENIISDESLAIVRKGMRSSVSGPRRVIVPLTDASVSVAAKTGTAEFGRVNSDGTYEHTHAWVTGFFPYDDPKYSFVFLLEDGGASNNSAQLAREFIDWWEAH